MRIAGTRARLEAAHSSDRRPPTPGRGVSPTPSPRAITMATPGEGQYSVNLEWLDPHSSLLRTFQLKFFEVDGTLQIYDTQTKKMFLKRVAPPENTSMAELYVGNTVTIYSRKMRVVSYADERTARLFTATRSRSMAVVLPRAVRRLGAVLQGVREVGLDVGRMRSVRLTPAGAKNFLAASGGKAEESEAAALASGAVVAVELVGKDCWALSRALAGGSGGLRISPSEEAADRECAFMFDQVHDTTALHRNCTVCVLRPRVVADGTAARILREIQEAGFTVSAVAAVEFSRGDATDLLAAYKGVVREYGEWVEGLSCGVSWALELVGGEDVVHKFRAAAGPYNPEVAALLRPDTLRAKYGKDAAANALHCTDLSTDAPLESKFIFHVLPRS